MPQPYSLYKLAQPVSKAVFHLVSQAGIVAILSNHKERRSGLRCTARLI